jgi:hypothetical protein
MPQATIDDLIKRLCDHEDSFVERKLEGDDLKRSIVAFANSVPAEKEGIIFVGIRNDGKEVGVENPDALQKKIQKFCNDDCFPSIHFTTKILRRSETVVLLAIIIPASLARPHFAGPAFVRQGTKSVVASKELYEDLITSRNSKAGELLRYKGQAVTIVTQKNPLGRPAFAGVHLGSSLHNQTFTHTCRVEDVTPFFVRFKKDDKYFTEPIQNIEISYDETQNRPLLIVRLDSP